MKKDTLLLSALDRKTESVYRSLLSLADAPASQIARRSGIKRTSVYHILENLSLMGLVSSYQERGTRRFVAEHPSKLKTFFERQLILAERIIPDLEKEIAKSRLQPTVRLFEGKEAVKSMMEEALGTKEKTILSIGSSRKLLECLGGKYGWGQRRREQKIFQRALRFPDDEIINSSSRLHDIRILPESFRFPGFILIFDTYVATILYDESPRGVLINDPAYAIMMKSVFEALWELAKR